ncbi:uncharacterized protein EAF01_002719 [Botrytis porri]|uniref:Uncharacterized protein n=1 Tax=Botrytis porri TaxID=87229 RepID=A0A4Z1KXY9_9HELO|nr:uncharacterized protein EAF01_002719 [Botrytis porri]KAF7911211.1 hypothetical protein EAF01_002719 [Botrytis porri]TGO89326.1 hypothetical protein BPOR_0114g00070 [Botrytis porri]
MQKLFCYSRPTEALALKFYASQIPKTIAVNLSDNLVVYEYPVFDPYEYGLTCEKSRSTK